MGNRPRRLPAIATLLFAIEMLVVLLFLLAIYSTFNALVAARATLNTALTAGLEQAAMISATAGGAYTNVGWDGRGIVVDPGALPPALAQTLIRTVPASTATMTGDTLTWVLPESTAAIWHVTGPIVITQLQATTGPDQAIRLQGRTVSYPTPVLAGVVSVPLRVVSGFGVTWSYRLTESVVLPLVGRTSPAPPIPYQPP